MENPSPIFSCQQFRSHFVERNETHVWNKYGQQTDAERTAYN